MSESQTALRGYGQERIFDAFRRKQFGTHLSSDLAVLDILREAYPNCNVTAVIKASWDFTGFAKAGHAECTLDPAEETYVLRAYKKATGPRVDQESGHVGDLVKYGSWGYSWEGHEYIAYNIECEMLNGGMRERFFLINSHADEEANKDDKTLIEQLIVAVGEWSSAVHDDIYVFDDGNWRRNPDLWKSIQGSTWDDVIISPEMKSSLIGDVDGFFDNRELYKKLAVPWKRGLILHGVPGNGKTLTIKALISTVFQREDPIPSLYVKSLDSERAGVQSIRSIFTHARAMAPCLLIFEDLDSLINDKIRAYFLNEVDGLESNDGILMVGSTNHLDTLDPAITKRPSRFDRKYHFSLPDEDERCAYTKYWQAKLLDNDMVVFPDELCSVISKMTVGFSFAYLKELFMMALLTIARGGTGEEDAEKPVMVNRAEAVPSVEDKLDNVETGEGAEITDPEDKKHVIPNIETPELLKTNVLLKVLRVALQTLVDEMDNTDEKDWPSTKKQTGSTALGVRLNPPRRRF